MTYEATRHTLIQRIKNKMDEGSWAEFTQKYEPYIKAVLVRSSLANNEVEDLAQDILLKLWKSIENFEYIPEKCRFRTWLSLVCNRAICSYFKVNRNRLNSFYVKFPEVKNDKAMQSEIDSICEREWKLYISKLAHDRVTCNFSEKVMNIYYEFQNNQEISEIAARYHIKENSVYSYNKRVKDALIREVILLLNELD